MTLAFTVSSLTPALLSQQLDDRVRHKFPRLSPVRTLTCLGGGDKGFYDRFYSTLPLLLRAHKRHTSVEYIAQIQPLLGGGGLTATGST